MAARLATLRPLARPAHMLRYPVTISTGSPTIRPAPRSRFQPAARWDDQPSGRAWTRAAMAAIAGHGAALTDIEPRDIANWCLGYADASTAQRRAFWVGLMSALAKHESTYNPRAVGGGDRWFGLLQIAPATARGYECRAQTGAALQNAAENLSCAARIMAVTVIRDNAIAINDGRWRGVAADWGPMRSTAKTRDMAAWTRQQNYCSALNDVRPVLRPRQFAGASPTTATPQPD